MRLLGHITKFLSVRVRLLLNMLFKEINDLTGSSPTGPDSQVLKPVNSFENSYRSA